jgi:hypothetical protein
MRSIRIPGEIDNDNRLILDESLDIIKPQRVEIDIIFLDDDLEDYREQSTAEILEGIKEGFHDCVTGNTLSSMSELWERLGINTTGEINEAGQLILDEPLKATTPQYVDVVIWFSKNTSSQAESVENSTQTKHEVLTKELVTATNN